MNKIKKYSIIDKYNDFLNQQSGEFNSNIDKVDKKVLDYNLPIAHYLSNDKNMSRGVALKLKDRITDLDKLIDSNSKTGDVLISNERDKPIFHLIAKQNYWETASYIDIFSALTNLKLYWNKNKLLLYVYLHRLGNSFNRIR